MGRKNNETLPLGLPEQVVGLATTPSDRGDETQERFRYQWAIGVWLLAQSLSGERVIRALWCEHHEDYLLELPTGRYIAVQVKTDISAFITRFNRPLCVRWHSSTNANSSP